MQKAIANEMTRLELAEFLSDHQTKKEFFALMKLKKDLGSIGAIEPSSSSEAKKRVNFKFGLLAAASLFLISALALYFRFFYEAANANEFEVAKSIVTGTCEIQNFQQKVVLKSGKESFCDHQIQGEIGLIVRTFPESEFQIHKNEDGILLELRSGIVIVTTKRKNSAVSIRARVHSISSQLLGTTLVLFSEGNLDHYKILVLEGNIRVPDSYGEAQKTFDVGSGYSIFEMDPKSKEDSSKKIVTEKINPKDLKKYSSLSDDSQKILQTEETKHDSRTVEYIKRELTSESNRIEEPTYKITLKDKTKYVGKIQENENSYILTDKKGVEIRIDKKDIVELELVP
ncbi:iron dicitrate transport regulator FecR [Leptospira sp. 201903070]|uniref:Iron dicitrate transport regulator FecR n=1 Tax=Leptospira ainlahdjerensis TaxID=2810033 RepID=A0ABS2UET0_9LEPT|nr:iron dicitrate transport regulator FecR [Leptospira ainlahdjerensis]MBM9577708.1 iron dicitrate transport regulator FecR [Leptospira ainlahdjerensis]MBM9577712.1 iron dicitrate transport regulator FecR [Leptospira ainlahdjerensis]